MASKVFPTKNNLISAKKSLSLSQTGYELMDKKKTILIQELMHLADDYNNTRRQLSEAYNDAYASLKSAHIQLGSLTDFANCIPVDNSAVIEKKSVMGVETASLKYRCEPSELYYGLSSTSTYLDDAYFCFNKVKLLAVKLAEQENNLIRLADAVSKTQKRTNALNNIMIPEFTETVKYISDALDEKEREDFSRLKVIKNIKENDKNEKQ